MEFRNITNPSEPIYCHFCERDISRRVYIVCENCPRTDICVECFANGCEGGRHRRTHPYRVFSRLDTALFEDGWTGYDELALLRALQSVGYGNWEETRAALCGRSADEIELHFKACYQPFLGRVVPLDERRAEIARLRAAAPQRTLLQCKLDEMAEVLNAAKARESGDGGAFNEILGFMPLRREFDVEYDNDFELYLAEMEFADDDTEEEIKTKHNMLEIYNKMLVEREKRKEFVIEHGLLDLHAQLQREKRMSPIECQIRNSLKPFMRFTSKAEFDELVGDMCREVEMRQSLELLIAAQKSGLKSLDHLEALVFSEQRNGAGEERLLARGAKARGGDPLEALEKRAARRRQSRAPVDAGDEPPNFLNAQKALCEELALSVKEFLLVKEYIVRLAFRDGFVNRRAAAESVQIETEKFDRIFDFFVANDIVIEDKQ